MLRSDQLPPPLCPWLGPRSWVDGVAAALHESRWVTLVGPVGSGKTRIARETGSDTSSPRTIHVQLDLGETVSSLESKLNALPTDEHPLLVVDAGERAADAVRTLVPRWLGVNDARRVLVTSRVQLGPDRDRTIWVAPLEVGHASALFERFVRDAGVGFDLDAHRAGLQRALLDLGGSPLAILGLARRALVLDPPDLFDSVSHRSGRLDLPTASGTLRDAAREAWAALPVPARPWVSALAVFAEPALPEDIASVSRLDPDRLQTLFAHSAIRSRRVAGHKRLEVVPILRDFVLDEAPDSDAAKRHRVLFLSRVRSPAEHPPWRELAAAAERTPDTQEALALWVSAAPAFAYAGSARRALTALEQLWPERPTPLQRLAYGNLARIAGDPSASLSALQAGYDEADDPELKAELACALAITQRHTQNITAARSSFARIIDASSTPAPTRARACENLGGLEFEQGSVQLAEAHLLRAEGLFHRLGDVAGYARVLHLRGLLAQEHGNFDAAEQSFAAAFRDHQASGASRFCAIARFDQGALLLERGRVGAARRALRQALEALRHTGDRRQIGLTHALLAICAQEEGDPAAAWLELGKARDSIDAADSQATETLDLYLAYLSGTTLPTPTSRSDEARYAQRLVGTLQHHARTRVSIREDGGVVDHPTRGRAEVRSDAARNILAALVAAFEGGSTPVVHRDVLIRAGWPERKRVDTASRNRLNVELSRLRKSGLHEQLERGDEGYRLTGPLLVEAVLDPS